MPWNRDRPGVRLRTGGGISVCIPVCSREVRCAGEFAYSVDKSSCHASSAALSVVIKTRCMGTPERLAGILGSISRVHPTGGRTYGHEKRVLGRLKALLVKLLNRCRNSVDD